MSPTAIVAPPQPGASAGSSAAANTNSIIQSNVTNIADKVNNFLAHIGYALVCVLIWGFICANVLSFTRPDTTTPNNKANYTNEIFKELDLLFPDDTEFAPYGFHWKRGVPDSKETEKNDGDSDDETEEQKQEEEREEAEASAKGIMLGWVNKLRYKKDDKTSMFPYNKFSQDIDQEGKLKRDNETNTGFLSEDGYFRSLGQLMSEWMLNSIYFSYGNSHVFIKKMFKMLNAFMVNKTPSARAKEKASEPDTRSDYAYMTNTMVVTIIPLFVFIMLIFFVASFGSIMMVAGSVLNKTYHKLKPGAGAGYDKKLYTRPIVDGFFMTLIMGSFSILPIAGLSYFIQPANYCLKVLTYPIARGWMNFKRVFFEIIPILVALFTMAMCFAALYDFENPISYVIVGCAIISYIILFKDNILRLLAFVAGVKGGLLETKNYNPDNPRTSYPSPPPSAPPLESLEPGQASGLPLEASAPLLEASAPPLEEVSNARATTE
jgi:hypothetical protein